MKRKILSVCGAIILIVFLVLVSIADLQASSTDLILDGSYLTHDNESIGYDTKITRGEIC